MNSILVSPTRNPHDVKTIVYQPEPVRIFKSDLLERFTHIHPATIPILWLPVAAYFLWLGRAEIAANGTWYAIPAFILGIVIIWTFIEYVLHRFLFHWEPQNKTLSAIMFLLHGVHHLQPNCKERLVMPPFVAAPIVVLFYFLFQYVIIDLLNIPHWFAPIFSGTVTGYVIYDMTHYAVHHWPMKGRFLKALRRHHMLHHFQDPHTRFGVTSPMWDYTFGTQPDAFMKGNEGK